MLVNAEKVVVLFNACFNLPRCLVWCFVSRKDAVGKVVVGVLGLWVADEAEAEAEAEEEEEEETALLIFL